MPQMKYVLALLFILTFSGIAHGETILIFERYQMPDLLGHRDYYRQINDKKDGDIGGTFLAAMPLSLHYTDDISNNTFIYSPRGGFNLFYRFSKTLAFHLDYEFQYSPFKELEYIKSVAVPFSDSHLSTHTSRAGLDFLNISNYYFRAGLEWRHNRLQYTQLTDHYVNGNALGLYFSLSHQREKSFSQLNVMLNNFLSNKYTSGAHEFIFTHEEIYLSALNGWEFNDSYKSKILTGVILGGYEDLETDFELGLTVSLSHDFPISDHKLSFSYGGLFQAHFNGRLVYIPAFLSLVYKMQSLDIGLNYSHFFSFKPDSSTHPWSVAIPGNIMNPGDKDNLELFVKYRI